MFDSRKFGNRVLLSRRDLKWDQEELARVSGVSRSRISEIERGRGTNVGIDAIFALAQALGVTAGYLLALTDDPLGEPSDRVANDDSLVIEVETTEQRILLQQVIDVFTSLPSQQQRFAINMLRMMRQAEEEENATPRIVE
jgi:transcriptional regulator with XRE-family HTH domain